MKNRNKVSLGNINGIRQVNNFSSFTGNSTFNNITINSFSIFNGNATFDNYTVNNRINYAQVEVRSPNGNIRLFKTSTNTDSARGQLLLNAQGNASANDTIFVGPGTYIITSTLGKNGVNWWFAPGATVKRTDSDNTELWSDNGTDMDFVVDGYARFIHNGNEGTGIEFTNSGSNIIMKFLSIETTFNDINTPAIHTSNGTIKIYADDYIKSAGYDAIWNSGNTTLEVHSSYIYAYENAVEVSGGYETRVHANRIEGNAGSTSGNSGTLNFDGGNNIYIYADRITALANDYIVLYTLTQNGNHTTNIYAQKIDGYLSLNQNANVNIYDATINSSKSDTSTIVLSNNNLTLKDVNLITNSSQIKSIESSSSVNISIVGTLTINKPLQSTINIITGNVNFNSTTILPSITLPPCNANYTGAQARNSTKIYFCDGSAWNALY